MNSIRWLDGLDVVLVAAILWAGFSWLRQTRSRLAFFGVMLLSGIYLGARQLELQLTTWLLQGFFAVLVFVLVVVFQEDLRRLFEHIAVWGLRRRAEVLPRGVLEALVGAVLRQIQTRTGALYVLAGRESLERHLEGGIELDARISEPLLLSLFEPHSPGHDGALILRGERVERFATRLPLSNSTAFEGGTRHAAALGLSERCDALSVVVSEERGVVSVARGGVLRRLGSPALLAEEVRGFLAETARPAAGLRKVEGYRPWLEALAALALAIGLWAVLVYRHR